MNESITWVGLDVHKNTIAAAIVEGASTRPKVLTFDNESRAIKRLVRRLEKNGGQIRACYEAGPCGFELYRQLSSMRIHCEVIAPSLIPKKPGERVKTDKRDATKLATMYRAGLLTPIRVPTEGHEALRDLVRARTSARREVRAAKHRLSKFLLRHGRIYSQGKQWTQRHGAWLKKQSFTHQAAQITFDDYVLHLRYLIQRLEELDRKLFEVSDDPSYQPAIQRLRCLRGIDTLSAVSLLAELQDFRRFSSPRELAAFVGLIPSEFSSGDKAIRGKITKAGNTHARRILIEAAWHYRHPVAFQTRVAKRVQGQPPHIAHYAFKAQRRLNARYRRLIGRGKKPQTAIVAVARELTGFIWALMNEERMPLAS